VADETKDPAQASEGGAIARIRRVFAQTASPRRTTWLFSLMAVASALAVGYFAILLTGKDALGGYTRMLAGAFSGSAALGETGIKTAVLTCTGLSVGLAFVVGLFNIGAEGQFIAGALGAAVAGYAVRLPAPLHVPFALLCAAAAGALPALIAAWLKVQRGVHEVISTIMLNWVVIYLVHDWLVVGPFRAPSSGAEISASGTAQIHATAELPRLFADSRLDIGLPLALTFALLAWFLLGRTVVGYELRAVGANAEAARVAGIPVARRMYLAMGLAGALAGIGGAFLILGTEHRYPGVFRTGYGFDGIAVALVGGGHPLGVLAAAGFFGGLRAGATRLQLVGIHPSFAELIQGMAVLFVATRGLFAALFDRIVLLFRRRA
jgi:simple sugar transport system permease protein